MSQTYDPSRTNAVFLGGVVDGWVSIKVKRNEDAYSTKVSTDGQAHFVANKNKSGEIEITCTQSSLLNDRMSAAAALDELTGAGVGPFALLDLNGTSIVAAPNCRVKKVADGEWSKDSTDRVWTLVCDKLESFLGGIV